MGADKEINKKINTERVAHTFEPIFDGNSRILILGTFPSVKSRENNFYYGHPQNRFWKLLALLTKEAVPVTIKEKKELLLKHGIAIWDVICSCEIEGSSDSSIKNVEPNNLDCILEASPIKDIFGNGAKACQLYDRYMKPRICREIIKLPSTSPANAAWTLDKLFDEWGRVIGRYVDGV